jgi:hypothetical protein
VAERIDLDSAEPLPSAMLVNLRDGSMTELLADRHLRSDAPTPDWPSRSGPAVVWSEDSEWVLIDSGGITAVRISDGLTAELEEWIPADMQLYAVASR